jgi:hypothetical protein
MAKRTRGRRTSRPKLRLGKKTYERSLDAAKVAGVISVIFGVVFGTVQYFQARDDKRIEESLQLFRQFNNAPYTDYRKRINVAIIENQAAINAAVGDEKKLAAAVLGIVQKEKLETDVAFVLNFFDTVAYCAAQSICDSQIVLDLFYPSALEIYVPFYQYIRMQQNALYDYGAGVFTLVDLKRKQGNAQANVAAK